MWRFSALVGILAACGSSGPSVAYSDFDQALQTAKCQRLARCGQFPDEASCTTFFRLVPDTSLAAAIDAGNVHYDGERAKQCVDATAAQSCDLTAHDSRALPSTCA